MRWYRSIPNRACCRHKRRPAWRRLRLGRASRHTSLQPLPHPAAFVPSCRVSSPSPLPQLQPLSGSKLLEACSNVAVPHTDKVKSEPVRFCVHGDRSDGTCSTLDHAAAVCLSARRPSPARSLSPLRSRGSWKPSLALGPPVLAAHSRCDAHSLRRDGTLSTGDRHRSVPDSAMATRWSAEANLLLESCCHASPHPSIHDIS